MTTCRARVAVAVCAACAAAHAGPPYATDDPEPVAYRHWELYLATQHALTSADTSGTAPHVEVNYGAWPDVQLHVIAPLAYARPSGGPTSYGPGDVELGIKLRFVHERGARPMIGTFPLVELPTGSEREGLGAGHVRVFLPLWLQASSGAWTTYGGGGYWLGPVDFAQLGWQAQRRVGSAASVGGELYFLTGTNDLRFDVGAVVDVTEHHHLMASIGRSISGDTRLQGYFAYQLTL